MFFAVLSCDSHIRLSHLQASVKTFLFFFFCRSVLRNSVLQSDSLNRLSHLSTFVNNFFSYQTSACRPLASVSALSEISYDPLPGSSCLIPVRSTSHILPFHFVIVNTEYLFRAIQSIYTISFDC